MKSASIAQIPFLDIRAQNAAIWNELQDAIGPVMENAQFILGPAVEEFERDYAEYCGSRHCVGLNSGTAALHMALVACDIGPGDEVITTPHTWISTSWAISYVGAKPVFVDIDPTTYNIDASLVEQAITPRTKAVLPVHLYGQSCEITKLKQICDNHNLVLIEDAAQAHGAMHDGRRVGSIGTVGCFSFYPGKNLGAFGEGGAIVTDDEQLANRIRRLRDHAQDGRHHHVEIGYNTRMDGIQGAVLSVKLRHLDAWNAARRSHAQSYRDLLADLPDITTPCSVDPQSHVFHLFVILVEGSRDAFRAQLASEGVATGVHYPTPVPLQPAYADLGHRSGDFPVAEQVMSRCVSLPMFAELENSQIDFIGEKIRNILTSK